MLTRLDPLPVRNGVGPSRQYLPAGNWPNLLAFLGDFYPQVPLSQWLARIERGELVDASGKPWLADSGYHAGSWIFYYREIPDEPEIPYQEQILYQDEHLLVVDKPHFVPVTPSGRFLQQSLLVRLKRKLALADLAALHRLDRETAGVVLFSTNPRSRAAYAQLFEQRQIDKSYLALSAHLIQQPLPLHYRSRLVPAEPFYLMQQVAGTANTETRIELLAQHQGYYRYQLHPVTGKKHQLRLHMASLGAPILNDPYYPQLQLREFTDYHQPLQLLAQSLEFTDPLSQQRRRFVSQRQLLL